ncbi:MAG TPA: type II toxin-antitoxin system prevent-host-death family antitoxin [Sphingomonadaceae bacterium]
MPISEFKDHASELVSAAERGEEIVITRHGKPAVVLKALRTPAFDREKAEAAMTDLLARRDVLAAQGITATAEEWIAWKNEGRR